MRLHTVALWLLAALPACAAPARYMTPGTDREVSLAVMVSDLARNDVVVLGETHDNRHVHEAHLAIVQALYQLRPDMVLSMEMFERDVQSVLYQYLLGDIHEAEFLRDSRPWPNYPTDYRPLVEWAKANGVPILAANAPRRLASKAAKEGLAAVHGDPLVARQISAPEDLYWSSFKALMESPEMQGHAGGPEQVRRTYESQCLKDDTMAETIADFLQEERKQGHSTMVVHLCGTFHSDHRRGTVSRIASRRPDARIAVLSVDEVPEPNGPIFTLQPEIADYVLVVAPMPKELEKPVPAAAPGLPKVAQPAEPNPAEPNPAEPQVAEPKPAPPPSKPADRPEQDAPPPGARPALGLMPDYGSDQGMRVQAVTEGGPAWVGGVKDGDIITKVAGVTVSDVSSYSMALETVKIGQLIEIEVKRGTATKTLKVEVGVRSR